MAPETISPNILVMKFGGTSMGSADRIRASAAIVIAEHARRPTVIVVSAMSRIPDRLLDSLRQAESGDRQGLDANLAHLSQRHEEACRGLLPEARQDHALAGIRGLLGEFSK